jgi:putative membrane protein insertion efficiency factor
MRNHRKYLGEIAAFIVQEIWKKRVGVFYNSKTNTYCRFYPSCSDYAVRALQKYGLLHGTFLAAMRIKRCNPSNTESCIDYP